MSFGCVEFETLRKEFREFFSRSPFGYEYPSDRFNGGAWWEYAVVKGAPNANVHYELIRRGNELYIELHVETHPRNVPNWHELQRRFSENSRFFMHYTYYSSNYWRTRIPLRTVDELRADLMRITDLLEGVFENSGKDGSDHCVDSDLEQELPFQRDPKYVAAMLGENGVLKMPAVQRGKVWNASRIEALWDSILRGFSIGAFSVQKLDDHLDLLDGQQRSSAIALAYSEFPPLENRQLDSVLWLDLNPKPSTLLNSQKQFMVYVTTASQPWGYASSSDETKNVLLSVQERRESLKDAEWHNKSEKPYPGELSPHRAEMPVPLNLLLRFAEENCEKTISEFVKWCDSRSKDSPDHWWGWLGALRNQSETPAWEDFFFHRLRDGQKIPRAKQLEEFPVFFIDAGSVDENDVSLYFTRIGKGGVRPSDEELAFSVLKSKLGVNFKNTIEGVSANYGLAQPARIAHLAIRCYFSSQTSFFSASVLDAVLKMCKRGSDGSIGEDFDEFMKFVEKDFVKLIKMVDQDVFGDCGGCLTQWHRNRFCNYHNGDVYLFLLLAKRYGLVTDMPLSALAAIIFEKAMNPDRTIRYVMTEGVREGIAHSMRETYRGVPRFGRIVRPEELRRFVEDIKEDGVQLSQYKDMARERYLYGQIATGYGNQKAYSMLLYACKDGYEFGAREEYHFGYNPNLGIWSEDNCPWDYDHVLPHSWIEKMPSGVEADVCNWLMNSLGNLAPLPFAINRSLSDDSRDSDYPYCCQHEDSDKKQKIQNDYMLDGQSIGKMANFRSSDDDERLAAVREFCLATITRYCRLYCKWYEGLGVSRVTAYPSPNEWADGPRMRRELLVEISARWSSGENMFKYCWHDNTERPISGVDQQYEDWNIWDWISVSHELNGLAVEVKVNRTYSKCELGVCKLASETDTNDRVRKLLGATVAGVPVKKDGYWYAVKKIHPKEGLGLFDELLNIEQECVAKCTPVNGLSS